jgi:DNA-binding winged helix-turn-helix (wHTH) protein
METIYVIENTLRFNPTAHTLHSIESNERITLAIPASLCFILLIKNQGRIVTQAELLHNAWGERGMNVTPNTLHQNISLLRKSLNRLHVNGSIIQTIPKRGFMIADDTTILARHIESDPGSEDDSGTNVEENVNNPHQPPAVKSIAPQQPDPEPPRDNLSTSPPVNEDQFAPRIFSGIRFSDTQKGTCRVAGFASLLAIVLLVYVYYFPQTSAPFFSYTELATPGTCKVFRNDDLRFDEFFINFMQEKHISCSDGQAVYITNHYPSSRTSLIVCRHPITSSKKSFCTSSYYLK